MHFFTDRYLYVLTLLQTIEFGRVDAANKPVTPLCVGTGTHVLQLPLNAIYFNQVPPQLQALHALPLDLFQAKELIYSAFEDMLGIQCTPP